MDLQQLPEGAPLPNDGVVGLLMPVFYTFSQLSKILDTRESIQELLSFFSSLPDNHSSLRPEERSDQQFG